MRLPFLLLMLPLLAAAAGRPHQHGVAHLDVAVDRARISVQLEAPLDVLVGFERAPRTEAERRRADEALATLRAGDKLFRIDPAAECRLERAELASPVLEPSTSRRADADDGHADLTASYTFACVDASRARHLDVDLFANFGRLRRLDVQVVGEQGQSRHTLRRTDRRLPLARRGS